MLKPIIFEDTDEALVHFRRLLREIYSEDELKTKSNSIFQGNYLFKNIGIFKKDKICAFASIFINPNIQTEPIGTIGNFEIVNDSESAQLLFKTIETQLKNQAIYQIIGPMDGSTWEKYRLPLSSDHPVFYTEESYPNYYNSHFVENGYQILEKYISNKQAVFEPSAEQREWLKSFKSDNNLTFNYLTKKTFLSELPRIQSFCNLSFKENRLFSPITQSDFIKKHTLLDSLIHPISVILVENADRNLLGLLFTIPNFYSKNELIVKTIAVHPEFRSRGLATALGIELMYAAMNSNFKTIIHAFMHNENHSKNVSKKYQGEIIREYVLYTKAVSKNSE